jgi:hypothetical protein
MVTSSTKLDGGERKSFASHVVIRSFLRVAQPVTRRSIIENTA